MVLKMTLHVPKNLLSVERKHAFFVGRTYKTKFSPSECGEPHRSILS